MRPNDPIFIPPRRLLAVVVSLMVGLLMVAYGDVSGWVVLRILGFLLATAATVVMAVTFLEEMRVRQSDRLTHRCRLYRGDDRVLIDAVEVWDTLGRPALYGLPEGRLLKTFTGSSEEEVREAVDAYLVEKEQYAVGSWNHRGMI
jgi:hypothetical protein